MNYDILKTELQVDPLTRGYATMSDAEVAASLNTVNRERNRPTLTGSAVLNAINEAEFDLLTAEKQQRIWDLLHLGELNPHGVEATLFVDIFGPTSATITQLKLIRVEAVSRATELEISRVRVGDVERARA
ncbi:MAG TPA: hypothetical protein VMY37_04270 [Thermoguttaceae bacterium]|nr:hypothetical protein [Thermoguttaceae bacterium]